MRVQWWERRGFVAALLIAVAIPLVWPAVPPLLDLPGHMGRYAIFLHRAGDASLTNYYDYHWALLGNLGVDLLMVPLGRLLGVEPAAKLIVILIPITMAAGFLWTARQVHGRLPATAPLALVFAYAYPLHYGFVNYVLGMALVAVAFALWISMASGPAVRRVTVFALIAAAIWVTHAIAWVALCALCGGFELQRRLRGGEPVGNALLRSLLRCLPLGTGLVLTALAAGGPPGTVSGLFDPAGIAKAVLSLNRDRWMAVDLATSFALLAIVALAVLRRNGLSLAPALAWPALALVALFLVIPDSVNDSAYLKTRILPWAVAYALLAIDTGAVTDRARWAMLSLGVLMLRLGATTASLLSYGVSYASALRALDQVPMGSRIATFTVNACRPTLANWTNSRRQHLGGMAVVRRHAFVNDQFEAGSLQLLHVRYEAAGRFRHSPSEVVALQACPNGYPPPFEATLDALPRAGFDYVWLLDVPETAWPQRAWLRPVFRDAATILYRVVPPSRPAAINRSAVR